MNFKWRQRFREVLLPAIGGAFMSSFPAFIGGLPVVSVVAFGFAGLLAGLLFFRLHSRDRDRFQADSRGLEILSAILPGVWYECRVYPDGRRVFDRVSQTVTDFLGISLKDMNPEELQLMNWVHPEDRERIAEGVARHSRTLEHWTQEYRFLRPDGTIVWVKSRAHLAPEPDGSTLWRGVIIDITARKDAEAAIRKSEERLALATRSGRVAIWDYDIAARTISWNDVAYAIHGVDPATYEPSVENNNRFLHPDDQERVNAIFAKALASGAREYQVECRIVLPSGEVRTTQSAANILRRENGEPYRVIGTEIDVTEQKHLEAALILARDQAEAATRIKNEFLAMMSHEIRTPLNGVLGFAGLLRDSILSDEQRDYLRTIESSAESLLLLVGDILDLSRIEANQLRISPTFFELRPCLQEISALLLPRIKQKALAWELIVAPDAPRFIRLDRLRFIQILTNLIGNAVKYTDAGSVKLEISVGPAYEKTSTRDWRFAVIDTGKGLSPDVQEKLFTADFRAISPEYRSPDGNGLGLAISRRLAELLGGSILVRSAPASGSTFEFVVSAETRSESREAQPAFPVPVPRSNRTGCRILVVEDHPINLRLCEILLHRLGYETEVAETGLTAIAKWQMGKFDALLMDMQLPELDGCAATREIRRRETGGERVPIIAMTANAMPEDRRRCLDAGMDDYLAKPVKLEVLAATLARWLEPGPNA